MSSPSIRPFRPRDTDACYEICLRTGDAGGDASRLHTDPRVLGEVWMAPYLSYAPDLSFVIEDDDRTGGSAPSFIVEWIADAPVSDPIIHSVMIGTMSQQGISFLGEGVVLESR